MAVFGACRWLLGKGADMGLTDNGGCTALHWAAIGGEWTTARELVAKGASVNAKTLVSFLHAQLSFLGGLCNRRSMIR